jgi:hypothetical protein
MCARPQPKYASVQTDRYEMLTSGYADKPPNAV